jgi:hypothetical protein
MKKTRGKGFVYQPGYIDKRTGERRTASTWWIQYFVKGARFRELSNSRSRSEAEEFLLRKLEAGERGERIGPKSGKLTFEDLIGILPDDYRAMGRHSLARVEEAAKHQSSFFTNIIADQIDSDLTGRYIRQRREVGAASATIDRELRALRRALRLAQSAGKISSRPHISMLPRTTDERAASKLTSTKLCWTTSPNS